MITASDRTWRRRRVNHQPSWEFTFLGLLFSLREPPQSSQHDVWFHVFG
jgi:hypothetical protein